MKDRQEFLIAEASRFGVGLRPDAAERVLAYLDRLLEVNQRLNLTAVRSAEEALQRHLLDSLAFGLHAAEAGPPLYVVDVGTGGGFPGVPIAIAWPAAEVVLLDATRKKAEAVESLLRELGINNAHARWGRAEEVHDLFPADVVTSRAVGSIAASIGQTRHLLAPGGALVIWKSETLPRTERSDGDDASRTALMESLPDLEYELGAKRRLVRFRRSH